MTIVTTSGMQRKLWKYSVGLVLLIHRGSICTDYNSLVAPIPPETPAKFTKTSYFLGYCELGLFHLP
jgi:hypothetical protein